MKTTIPTHVVETIVSPGEVIVTTPVDGIYEARIALQETLRYELRNAKTPEERAMYRLALTKVPTMRPGQTISIGNGTAYALQKAETRDDF